MRKLMLTFVLLVTLAASLFIATIQEPAKYVFPEPNLNSPYAPFIYTWHYATEQGATAEWRKQEGVVIDEANQKIYMAVTRVRDLMADTEGDIQLEENRCGVVYVGDLDDSWNVAELKPLLIGGPYNEATETCAADNLSEPDNLYVAPDGNLWIAEDTELHANNVLWKYDMASGQLLRFATAPLYAEFTGLRITENGTLFLNLQDPDPISLYPYDRGTIGVIVDFNTADAFEPLPVPEGDDRLTVKIAAGTYQILGRGGETMPANAQNIVFGQFINAAGEVFTKGDQVYCNSPDGNMFLPINETEAYLYTNFECDPGGVSKLHLRQNEDGTWEVVEGNMVDFASVNGTRSNCNASVTPWNTGLTSEEFAPRNAEAWAEDGNSMNVYIGGYANPYDYGYIVELIPTETGTDLIRHYVMGRRDNEQAWVAPDAMTVYFGDDGSDNIFYKFIADEAGNLNAGTLYAAKITQTSSNGTDDYSFQLEWLELGHGTDEEISAAVRELDFQTGG